MTSEELEVAKRHVKYHTDIFGYKNFDFVQGYIEQLDEMDLEPESFDVVISNCVINLSSNKNAVSSGIKKLLNLEVSFSSQISMLIDESPQYFKTILYFMVKALVDHFIEMILLELRKEKVFKIHVG